MESKFVDDPVGSVTFDIYREGTEGVVNVQWRLSSDAAQDFDPPLTGTETFGPVLLLVLHFVRLLSNPTQFKPLASQI